MTAPSEPLRITLDDDRFDAWQIELGIAMARGIREPLVEAGLKGEALRKTTGDILFAVSALLDGASEVEVEGEALYPVLFATRDDGTAGEGPGEPLIGWSAGGTNLHEYAFGNVDWLFEEGS